jgi:ATP-dependent protease Clp ATPase subunit
MLKSHSKIIFIGALLALSKCIEAAGSGTLPEDLPSSPLAKIPAYTIVFEAASKPKPYLTSSKKRKKPTLEAISETEGEPIARHVIPTHMIQEHLGTFIAGQEEAIASLSLLAHRFLCNKMVVDRGCSPVSKPSHCILTGPTGCGKSETLEQLGRLLNVPVLHINARSLTDEGFKGLTFSESVSSFCEENSFPASAIVAIDEIDKLRSSRDEERTKNFGQAIQHLLLTPLDGKPLSLKGRKFSLMNWWFIGTGAFSSLRGIHDSMEDRTTTASTIIPFKGHTIETIMSVINRNDSPLMQIQNEFKLFYGVDLLIDKIALRRLADISIEINLGVRSLNTILSSALRPLYGQAAELMNSDDTDKKINVTLEDILPAIDQFARDNKEASKELPYPHMYL